MLIVVDGLIGAGKSTLCSHLSRTMDIKLMEEPVEDNPFLDKFYENPKKYALPMQFFLMAKRLKSHLEATEYSRVTGRPVIMDRSIYGDLVFCQVNHDIGNIDHLEFTSYLAVRESMMNFLKTPELTIYLDAKPTVCKERIASRGRECEQGITLDYLNSLDTSYKKVIDELSSRGSKTHYLDWNSNNFDFGYKEVEAIIKQAAKPTTPPSAFIAPPPPLFKAQPDNSRQEEIEEMLEFLLEDFPESEFYSSLQNFHETRGYLTPKQYDSLCNAYWRVKGENP
jgi:deoxyadenosine/deoxycytidine kinase